MSRAYFLIGSIDRSDAGRSSLSLLEKSFGQRPNIYQEGKRRVVDIGEGEGSVII